MKYYHFKRFIHMLEYCSYLQIVMKDIGNAGIIYDAFQSFIFAMERTIVEMAQMKIIVPEEVAISKEQRGSRLGSIKANSKYMRYREKGKYSYLLITRYQILHL